MSKKKYSVDEKKMRLLQIFHEKKEFFTLKELEQIAPKEKGIVANSVKDVLQALVDDDMVDTDKIGTIICFWAFPSKIQVAKKRKLEALKEEHATNCKKLKIAATSLEEIKKNEENTAEKKEILEKLMDMQIQIDDLNGKLLNLKKAKELYNKKQQLTALKDACNRWTDNTFNIKSWCKKKFCLDEATLNKQFCIPEDFDYI